MSATGEYYKQPDVNRKKEDSERREELCARENDEDE